MTGNAKRAAVVSLILALGLCVPTALAAKGDPEKKITKAGQTRAKAAALRLSYFPPGWTQKPHQKSSDDSDPRCSYYNPDQSDLVEIGDYDSPDFELPDGSSISSTTGVFRSVAMAKKGYARVAQPALAKCLAELFEQGAGPANTTIFSSGRLPFPHYGDRSDAYRIVASVKAPTARVLAYLDVFLFNRGATDVAVLAIGIGRAVPVGLEQSLVSKLARAAQ
jgi:hypothetical protein